ncbi:hypothetical protein FOBRF1_001015 [Fusarium oxysporum]
MSSFSSTLICRNLNDRVRRPLGQVHGPTHSRTTPLFFFLSHPRSFTLQSSSIDQVNLRDTSFPVPT